MTVPEFAFTSRARPVAEIGRSAPLSPDNMSWIDIGCDVHEIVTSTGRDSLSDRFVPGTAVITASNVSDWAGGTVPVEWSFFADDFIRDGPALGSRWEPWVPFEAYQPADTLVLVDEAAQVVARNPDDTVSTFVGEALTMRGSLLASGAASATVTIGPFPDIEAGDVILMMLALDMIASTTPGPSTSPTIPGWSDVSRNAPEGDSTLKYFRLWQHRVQPEEAASAATWTWPAALPSTVAWHYTAIVFGGATEPAQNNTFTSGNDGVFWWLGGEPGIPVQAPVDGCIVVRFGGSEHHHAVTANAAVDVLEHAAATVDWTWSTLLGVEVTGGAPKLWPAGYIPERKLTWTSGSEWHQEISVVVIPGPAPDPDSIPMHGASAAIWGTGFAGEQFVDVTMTGLAAPDRLWPGGEAQIQLALHASETSLAAIVAVIDWVPAWDIAGDDTGRLDWQVVHRDDTGSDFALDSGHLDFNLDGRFPATPVRIRFEATDLAGYRLYFQGVLLGSHADFDLVATTGDRVAVYASYDVGAVSIGGSDQMGPPRFEQIAGGSTSAPIYLEPGVAVRVGVDHDVFGVRWLFHGFVDAIVPTYDPAARPVSRIECIDALGEVGRLPIEDIGGINPEEAWTRVSRLLDEIPSWPVEWRVIEDDATWMANESAAPDKAVELLTQTAESCGGAIYGDPETGNVVFRARDWQAWDPDLAPEGYITNLSTPYGDAIPELALVVCPSTWQREWRRADMSTRVTYTSGLGDKFSFSNPDAEARFGVEPYERSLNSIEPRIMRKLGNRQLKLRGPGAFPRVTSVLLDASTGNHAVDMMTVSTFTGPSRYQCGLSIDGFTVFDRQYLVTGLRHTITRDRWQCQLTLDIADVFATKGARWGIGHWGLAPTDVWGRSI